MSVLNEFDASNVRYSIAERSVYLRGALIKDSAFKFTINCSTKMDASSNRAIHFFFNTESWQCLLVVQGLYDDATYKCFLTRFWIDEDIPVLSVRIFEGQDRVVAAIMDQFKEKYAALILDGIINS